MFTTLSWVDIGLVFSITLASFAFIKTLGRSDMRATEPSVIPLKRQYLFEFDHSGKLVCTNEHARDFLTDLKLVNPDWTCLRDTVKHRFGDLPTCINETETISDIISHVAVHNVLSTLPNIALVQAVSENAPFPVWQSNKAGKIEWSNAFYKSLARRTDRKDAPLFEITPTQDFEKNAQRISLKDPAHNRTHWFDVTRQSFEDGHLYFATDVHAVVNAETAQRNFVQTLAKTFAHLATGLAIFDRNRQLVLFNPSLFDLTELRPEFLTARPNLFSFFDQLRDNQIMPEQKNYAS